MEEDVVLDGRYEGLVESTSGHGSYETWIHGEEAGCQCAHGKVWGNPMLGQGKWCRHAKDLRGRVLEDLVKVLRAKVRIIRDPLAGRELLDEVAAITLHYRSGDGNTVAAAFLLHAYESGEACADDIHDLVGPYIEGDKRIIGIVAANLLKMGLLKIKEPEAAWSVRDGDHEVMAGAAPVQGGVTKIPLDGFPFLPGLVVHVHVPTSNKNSERRETNHGREIKRFVLTDAGRDNVAAAILRRRGVIREDTYQTVLDGEQHDASQVHKA